MRWTFKALSTIIGWASAEVLLTKYDLPNGGAVILFRAACVAIEGLLVSCLLVKLGGHTSDLHPTTIFVALFSGAYATFYTRYASQWTYLANIYHRIKETESRSGEPNHAPLAQWKAGFIEDVQDLHLACKPTFASIIEAWIEPDGEHDENSVRSAFERYALGGKERLSALLTKVREVCDAERERHRHDR